VIKCLKKPIPYIQKTTQLFNQAINEHLVGKVNGAEKLIIPQAKGDKKKQENMAITCGPCNYGRINFLVDEIRLNQPILNKKNDSICDGLERSLFCIPLTKTTYHIPIHSVYYSLIFDL